MNRDLCILEKKNQVAERNSEGEENTNSSCEHFECLSHSWACFRGYSRAGCRLAKMEVGPRESICISDTILLNASINVKTAGQPADFQRKTVNL